MSKSKATREAAKPLRLFVNPFSVWTDAVLKGGEAVIASMQAAAAQARAARVGVIPTADAPPVGNKRRPKARRKAKRAQRSRPQRSRQVVRRKSRRAARS